MLGIIPRLAALHPDFKGDELRTPVNYSDLEVQDESQLALRLAEKPKKQRKRTAGAACG